MAAAAAAVAWPVIATWGTAMAVSLGIITQQQANQYNAATQQGAIVRPGTPEYEAIFGPAERGVSAKQAYDAIGGLTQKEKELLQQGPAKLVQTVKNKYAPNSDRDFAAKLLNQAGYTIDWEQDDNGFRTATVEAPKQDATFGSTTYPGSVTYPNGSAEAEAMQQYVNQGIYTSADAGAGNTTFTLNRDAAARNEGQKLEIADRSGIRAPVDVPAYTGPFTGGEGMGRTPWVPTSTGTGAFPGVSQRTTPNTAAQSFLDAYNNTGTGQTREQALANRAIPFPEFGDPGITGQVGLQDNVVPIAQPSYTGPYTGGEGVGATPWVPTTTGTGAFPGVQQRAGVNDAAQAFINAYNNTGTEQTRSEALDNRAIPFPEFGDPGMTGDVGLNTRTAPLNVPPQSSYFTGGEGLGAVVDPYTDVPALAQPVEGTVAGEPNTQTVQFRSLVDNINNARTLEELNNVVAGIDIYSDAADPAIISAYTNALDKFRTGQTQFGQDWWSEDWTPAPAQEAQADTFTNPWGVDFTAEDTAAPAIVTGDTAQPTGDGNQGPIPPLGDPYEEDNEFISKKGPMFTGENNTASPFREEGRGEVSWPIVTPDDDPLTKQEKLGQQISSLFNAGNDNNAVGHKLNQYGESGAAERDGFSRQESIGLIMGGLSLLGGAGMKDSLAIIERSFSAQAKRDDAAQVRADKKADTQRDATRKAYTAFLSASPKATLTADDGTDVLFSSLDKDTQNLLLDQLTSAYVNDPAAFVDITHNLGIKGFGVPSTVDAGMIDGTKLEGNLAAYYNNLAPSVKAQVSNAVRTGGVTLKDLADGKKVLNGSAGFNAGLDTRTTLAGPNAVGGNNEAGVRRDLVAGMVNDRPFIDNMISLTNSGYWGRKLAGAGKWFSDDSQETQEAMNQYKELMSMLTYARTGAALNEQELKNIDNEFNDLVNTTDAEFKAKTQRMLRNHVEILYKNGYELSPELLLIREFNYDLTDERLKNILNPDFENVIRDGDNLIVKSGGKYYTL